MAARIEDRRFNARFLLIFGLIVFIVGTSLGVLIGYFIILGTKEEVNTASDNYEQNDEQMFVKLMDEIKPENLRQYLKYFTSRPHLAGTDGDNEQVQYTKDKWLEFGLDHVEAVPYELYLSYPSKQKGKENKVEILDPNTGDVTFTSRFSEEAVPFQPDHEDIVPPFNAFSAQGQVQGDIVYANYGRMEDFEFLKSDLNIDLQDRIALIRYGAIYRGNKVFNAMKFGIKAVILYSDPHGSTKFGDDVYYPHSIFMPPSGVQRGSVLGDSREPLTPGYPATKYAFRYKPEEVDILPKIPVHPISYGDAEEILRRMAGEEVAPHWRGGLDIVYRYGPGFLAQDKDKKVQVTINSVSKVTTSYNVIGIIRGQVEPDRYVLLGNHRDAWVYGAIDPASGTAGLMELARAFGKLVREGTLI
ncbi:glutamate carboxypeptidase 2-like [Ptychodera flava]|uniref:glutamate carboxypeptidase 2-like n=1 Tax=Ptychodera flava TaxID=63121 RepID=UPI003969FC5F